MKSVRTRGCKVQNVVMESKGTLPQHRPKSHHRIVRLCLAKTRSAATDVSVMVTTTANQWAGACVCSPESHRGLLPANRELAANPGGQISATVARLSTGCHSGGEARVAVVQTTDFWALDDLAHTGWVARG